MSQDKQISRRRTFAIISHPDAGKTTLTEKLLLFGGAIQLAGEVKARGDRRRARSDWLKVEKERGISVTSSVMTFEHQGCLFNLLDTPGHDDFSEDTYRTLTAVDSAIMVIDAAKGIEAQTRKLFEVCRLRDVPIITFVNKMDRDGKDPFDLMDEIEQTLALDVTPATWPIGIGQSFTGTYDILNDSLSLMRKQDKHIATGGIKTDNIDDPRINEHVPAFLADKLREEVPMVRELCPTFKKESYLEGHMTPVFFGSAINNFGVSELLQGIAKLAPSPRPQPSVEREVSPEEKPVTGFVFKIQANMDPKHRDRIAFVRLCSGHFSRGMKLQVSRTKKMINVHNALVFQAQARETTDEAWAGDIIGIPNHGLLRIGDSLSEKESLHFTGIPSFSPEILQQVRPRDPMKGKHLGKALTQLAEEGAGQICKTLLGSTWIVGVVGVLQFEVMADRIRTEYGVDVIFESTTFVKARWTTAKDTKELKRFVESNRDNIAFDHSDDVVFLARNNWQLERAQSDWPHVHFHATKEQFASDCSRIH